MSITAMSYLRGPVRTEVELLPPCLDDYVSANCPARFIDAYVEGLDFKALGFAHAQPAPTGRPPYHPADLTKLLVYGYLMRIRSSRRLEAEAARNLELIWLLRGVRPDFKTIADFRKNNRHVFKALFKQFNLLCRQMGLFGAELVAIDGSKFKAVNNSWRYYTGEQLRELINKIETRIDQYLSDADEEEEQLGEIAAAASPEQLQQKITQLRERKGRYEELLSQLEQQQQAAVSLTDADARPMVGPHGHVHGYNVQVAVDAKHHLIVAQEVVQDGNDTAQLAPMALAAKQALAVEKLKAVADSGYYNTDQLEICEQARVETFVSGKDPQVDGRALKTFRKHQFRYDGSADVYHCPAGQVLKRQYPNRIKGKEWIYYFNKKACASCVLRSQCTASQYRTVTRLRNEAVAERNAARVSAQPEVLRRRKTIVEHVYGTLRQWGHDTFLMRGLEKVRAEFSLSALVYNLRRLLGLKKIEDLLEILKNTAKTFSQAAG